MDQKQEIFESIKKIRKSKGITPQEMSNRTDISVNHLSQIERGGQIPPLEPLNLTNWKPVN